MGLNNSQLMLTVLGPYLQSAFPLSSRAVKSWIHRSAINFHSVIHSTNVYFMCQEVFLMVGVLLISLMSCYIRGNCRSIEERGLLQATRTHRMQLKSLGEVVANTVLRTIVSGTEAGHLWLESYVFIYSKLCLCLICP